MTAVELQNKSNTAHRLIGISLSFMFVLGIFAEFFVRNQLIDFSDTTLTMERIRSSLNLFRTGIAAFLLILLLDMILSVALYRITRPVNAFAALLSVGLRLVYVSTKGFAITGLVLASELYAVTNTLATPGTGMYFLKLHHHGFGVALFFFGIHLIALAWLLQKSNAVPTIIAWLLYLGGAGYSFNSLASIVTPHQEVIKIAILVVFIIPMTFSELALGLWLWVKGK